MNRPTRDLVVLILTVVVGLILLAAAGAVIAIHLTDPAADTSAVVIVLAEIVTLIVGVVLGQGTARRGDAASTYPVTGTRRANRDT